MKKMFQFTPAQAANTIISNATLPPQIDYVSPLERMKVSEAENFINGLPKDQMTYWSSYISDQIEKYYEPSIKGTDGIYRSVADLDAMF